MALAQADVVSGTAIATKFIYYSFGCTGQNVSPAVMWKATGPGTQSIALPVIGIWAEISCFALGRDTLGH
jgi:phosphatidylethanolamine-binding protein (PEBP) family uncharacterized protein